MPKILSILLFPLAIFLALGGLAFPMLYVILLLVLAVYFIGRLSRRPVIVNAPAHIEDRQASSYERAKAKHAHQVKVIRESHMSESEKKEAIHYANRQLSKALAAYIHEMR